MSPRSDEPVQQTQKNPGDYILDVGVVMPGGGIRPMTQAERRGDTTKRVTLRRVASSSP